MGAYPGWFVRAAVLVSTVPVYQIEDAPVVYLLVENVADGKPVSVRFGRYLPFSLLRCRLRRLGPRLGLRLGYRRALTFALEAWAVSRPLPIIVYWFWGPFRVDRIH